MLTFPDDFVWGVATASYQIEGATTEDGRGPSIWDTFSRMPGKVLNGDTGDVACDHYHRWQSDVELMKTLGVQAYRFSIAWPRVLPEGTGRINTPGLDFYDRLVDGLLQAGIVPFPTLYHWDLPQALDDEGGWLARATAEAFAEYADIVATRLGDRVKNWVTLNEPWVISHLGYGSGEHAPGHTNWDEVWPVAHHLLLGHGLATERIRRSVPGSNIGLVLNLEPQYPASADRGDVDAAGLADGYWNRWFLDPVAGRGYPADVVADCGWDQSEVRSGDMDRIASPIDLLGVNFYSRKVVAASEEPMVSRAGERLEEAETTAMGWEVYPAGLYDILVRVDADYEFPAIWITENGAAYEDRIVAGRVEDDDRISYIRRHLQQVYRALQAGVPVLGYFAWSLMDNFEWGRGYTKRFGLTYVDYETQARTIKKSGEWYSRVVSSNRVRLS
ncbi:MAG: GH1 family beta-glucosidase [Acidimicrobiia bacterium]